MDAILVPSCDFSDSGLGPECIERLVAAAILFQGGGHDLIITSGGYLLHQGFVVSEAEMMKEWLVKKGISSDQILVEHCALDTYENLTLTLRLLEECCIKIRELTIATDWRHFRRFAATADALGVEVENCEVEIQYSASRIVLEWWLMQMHVMDPLGKGLLPQLNRWLRTRPSKNRPLV